MCIAIIFKRFRMKVKPSTHSECGKRKTSIAIYQSQHLPFDSLQRSISSESIAITLNKTLTNNSVQSPKIKPNKLMRTPSHEKLMWQVVTVPTKLSDAFGSLLRYAQESINVFFCPT